MIGWLTETTRHLYCGKSRWILSKKFHKEVQKKKSRPCHRNIYRQTPINRYLVFRSDTGSHRRDIILCRTWHVICLQKLSSAEEVSTWRCAETHQAINKEIVLFWYDKRCNRVKKKRTKIISASCISASSCVDSVFRSYTWRLYYGEVLFKINTQPTEKSLDGKETGGRRGGGRGEGGGGSRALRLLVSFLIQFLNLFLNIRVDSAVEKILFHVVHLAVVNQVKIGLFLVLDGRNLTGKVGVWAGSSSSSSSSIFIFTRNRIILHGLPRNGV